MQQSVTLLRKDVSITDVSCSISEIFQGSFFIIPQWTDALEITLLTELARLKMENNVGFTVIFQK